MKFNKKCSLLALVCIHFSQAQSTDTQLQQYTPSTVCSPYAQLSQRLADEESKLKTCELIHQDNTDRLHFAQERLASNIDQWGTEHPCCNCLIGKKTQCAAIGLSSLSLSFMLITPMIAKDNNVAGLYTLGSSCAGMLCSCIYAGAAKVLQTYFTKDYTRRAREMISDTEKALAKSQALLDTQKVATEGLRKLHTDIEEALLQEHRTKILRILKEKVD